MGEGNIEVSSGPNLNPKGSNAKDLERIVVSRLRGGLGNQMFQYAIGRCISLTQNRELLLDDSPLDLDIAGTTKRRYALDVFGFDVALLRNRQWKRNTGPSVDTYLVEQSRGFCEQALKPNPFTYICLHGFWQNEKYFQPVADVIHQEFKVKPEFWVSSAYGMQIAKSAAPVCIHVRRQAALTAVGRHLGFIGTDYYRRATDIILQRVDGADFFVFSDDPGWCEENLLVDGPRTIVQHNCTLESSTATDFALMTMCRHFVIANSSFSWWAAWLGASPDKTVIAPAEWYRDDRQGSEEIVPTRWCRIATGR